MIRQTMVPSENSILKCDTIEHEGGLWLVPEWLHAKDEGWMSPHRIILLSVLPHQEGGDFADYILNVPIPTSVLDGTASKEEAQQFVVVERPAIRFPTGGLQ